MTWLLQLPGAFGSSLWLDELPGAFGISLWLVQLPGAFVISLWLLQQTKGDEFDSSVGMLEKM